MIGSTAVNTLFRTTVAIVFSICGGAGLAVAGPAEDFAEADISYQRGDFSTAMPLLRKAADAGHAQAQAVLASILDTSGADEEAVVYYRKSAAAGNSDGLYGLATMFAAGEGVQKDIKEALALFYRAADGGHKQAVLVLAQAHIRGELGLAETQRDDGEALKWINKAADLGFIVALEELEKTYRSGGYGLMPDVKKADETKQRIDTLLGIKEIKKSRRRGGNK